MTINRNCCACGRPILPGEPRWTGREPEEFWHYDCWRRVEDHVENNQGEAEGRAAELTEEYLNEPCPYCAPGKFTGLPGNACENCMNTGLAHPECS